MLIRYALGHFDGADALQLVGVGVAVGLVVSAAGLAVDRHLEQRREHDRG